jgi:hypothetical protein
MSMALSKIVGLLVAGLIWSTALGYVRVMAAKEKAGPGRPWGAAFMWTGWMHPETPRGKAYVSAWWALMGAGFVAAWLFLI